jgi:S1-C subfamily serine protease
MPGDRIVSINGQPVGNPSDVAQMLATLKPGQTVSIGLIRQDGSSATVKVPLGQYPGSNG